MVAATRSLLSSVDFSASCTDATIASQEVSSSARYSSSLPGKCWYNTGLETPARSAMSSIAAAWYPFATNTSCAASSSCARRASRGRRLPRFGAVSGDVDTAVLLRWYLRRRQSRSATKSFPESYRPVLPVSSFPAGDADSVGALTHRAPLRPDVSAVVVLVVLGHRAALLLDVGRVGLVRYVGLDRAVVHQGGALPLLEYVGLRSISGYVVEVRSFVVGLTGHETDSFRGDRR